MRIPLIVTVLTLVAFGSILLADLTEQPRPAVLDLIEEPERISTLTISADGTRAAAVVLEPGKKPRTTVLLYSTAAPEPKRFDIAGTVRDLLFMPEGSAVLGIQYKKAKRREGEARLLRFEPDNPKPRRLLLLPPTSQDLDFWEEREALLISCRNEVRSLLMPHLLSGPLYRLPGDNLAVASLPGSSMIVVGRQDELILVDLDEPHGLEEMPVRDSVSLDYPVIAISASVDGSYVLARLADESVYEWRIDSLPTPPPPQEEPEKPIEAPVVEPEPELVPAEMPPPPPEKPEEPIEPPVAEPEPEVVPAEVPPTPAAPPPPVVEPEATPAEEPLPPPPDKPEEPIEPPTAEPELEVMPAEEPPPSPPPQLRGTVDGPASEQVVAVVLWGPNNILREAQRVTPKSDGSWRVSGLAPGRYRVQLDGGGNRVLVTDPPFLMVDVEQDGTVDAGVIQVLGAL